LTDCGNVKTQSELSEDLQNFLSKQDLDKEIDQIKKAKINYCTNGIKSPTKAIKDSHQDLSKVCIKTPAYIIKEKQLKNSSLSPDKIDYNDTDLNGKSLKCNNTNRQGSQENLFDKNFLIIDEIINCVKQNKNESHANIQSEFYTQSNSSIDTKNSYNQKYEGINKKCDPIRNKIIGCYDESFSSLNTKYSSNQMSNSNNLTVMPKTSIQFNIFDDKKSSKNK